MKMWPCFELFDPIVTCKILLFRSFFPFLPDCQIFLLYKLTTKNGITFYFGAPRPVQISGSAPASRTDDAVDLYYSVRRESICYYQPQEYDFSKTLVGSER